MIGSSGV